MTRYLRYSLLALVLATACTSVGSDSDRDAPKGDGPGDGNFQECFDHGNDGRAPEGAPVHYRIHPGDEFPVLAAVSRDELEAAPEQSVLKLIIEDVRFTSYKCWDQHGRLTGFDIELMTHIAHDLGYAYIQFVPRVWSSYAVGEDQYLTLLVDLITGWGDVVSAGMSITEERQELVHMVGPIYKAGKKLMGRDDNPRIQSRLAELMGVPDNGYSALAGLSIAVQGGTIRADFFHQLDEAQPGLVEFLTIGPDGEVHEGLNPNKVQVLEVSADELNQFEDSLLTEALHGRVFDLVMVDTGSTTSMLERGTLGEETSLISGNLGEDPVLGAVFGLGDGISVAKTNEAEIEMFTLEVARLIRSGRVDALVEKWFNDDNAADHSWAYASSLMQ